MSASKAPSVFHPLKNGALFAVGFAATLGAIAVGLAVWNASMANVQSGDALTSTGWNAIVSNVLDLDSRTNAISSSVSNLNSTVNALSGTVSTLSSSATKAPYIRISLNQCGWGCTHSHAVDTFINVASLNFNWTTPANNATDVFSHNGKGLVTVSQAGTYRIRMSNIALLSSGTAPWTTALCPFVWGTVNCYGNTAIYWHRYAQSGFWNQNDTEFIMDLPTNQTIGFGYMKPGGYSFSYWAHDGYASIQVEKLN